MAQYCQNCYAVIPENDHDSTDTDEHGDESPDSTAPSPSVSTQPSTLTPPSHYDEFQDFLDEAKDALKGAFPLSSRPRNSTVGVLLLRFASDELGVISELHDLAIVFEDVYGFETEIWDIPDKFPQTELSNKINKFRDAFCNIDADPSDRLPLLIVYYGGHAAQPRKGANTCLWASKAENPCVKLNWTPVQAALFDAPADVLLLLDCCFASSAASRAGANVIGAKETVAACGPTSPTYGAGPRSFTSALITELRYQAESRFIEPVLTSVSLHACLLHNHQLKHQPVYARANITSRNSVALVPFPKPGDETTTERLARSNKRLVSVNIRVLVSVHLKKSPSHDLIRFLKNEGALPSNVLGISVDGVDKFTIRPEAAYSAFSSLTMISLPLAAWHLLPSHGACQFVGVVTSDNLLNDEIVLSKENVAKAAEQHEKLFALPTAAGVYTHMFPVPPPQPSDSGIGSEIPDESEDDEPINVERQPGSGSGAQKSSLGLKDRKLPTNLYGSWMAAASASDEDFEKGPKSLLPARSRTPTGQQPLQAASAIHMRACLRCFVTRNKCDGDNPCHNCSKKQRTWTLGCRRDRLQDASSLLLPVALTKHLEWAEVSSFMNQNAEYWRGEPFLLPLTLLVGEPLWVIVREVEPISQALLEMYSFPSRSNQPGETPEIFWLQSPPILPFYDGQKDQQAFDNIRKCVLTWCDSMSVPAEDAGHDWGRILFRKDHEHPERQLFYKILALGRRLVSGTPESELLQTMLRLLFFNYVMSRTFVVPKDEVEPLYQRLLHPDYRGRQLAAGNFVCPRGVNKFLKMLLLPVLQELTHNALSGLERILISRTSQNPEIAVSLSFLILIIAGRTEDSILERVLADTSGVESSLSKKDAEDSIGMLDWGVADVTIELNSFALGRWVRKQDDRVLDPEYPMRSLLPMLEDLSNAVETEASPKTESMAIDNSRRLLEKWCQKILPHISELKNLDSLLKT